MVSSSPFPIARCVLFTCVFSYTSRTIDAGSVKSHLVSGASRVVSDIDNLQRGLTNPDEDNNKHWLYANTHDKLRRYEDRQMVWSKVNRWDKQAPPELKTENLVRYAAGCATGWLTVKLFDSIVNVAGGGRR